MELSRRTFAKTLAASMAALTVPPGVLYASEPQEGLGISHAADAIHREAAIKATPARIYAALTEAKQFDGVTTLSAAMKSMTLKDTPSVISNEPGGAFALFGGYVSGRQIELVPNTRIIQVWRAGSWPAGAYSLVSWKLTASAAATILSMDHSGFPASEVQHLAEGWRDNYFAPLIKYLGS
jgi:activator of HSP90 ATPase